MPRPAAILVPVVTAGVIVGVAVGLRYTVPNHPTGGVRLPATAGQGGVVATGASLSATPTNGTPNLSADAAAMRRKERLLALATAPPQSPASTTPSSSPSSSPTWEVPAHAGLIGTPEEYGGAPVPFSPEVFSVTNMYLDLRGHFTLGVYAGSITESPDQGALRVFVAGPLDEAPPYQSGEFLTPTAAGPALLVSVDGDVVTFDSGGVRHTFNLRTHEMAPPG